MMFRNISTRKKLVLSALLLGLMFFVLSSPISSIIYNSLVNPQDPHNIIVTQKSNEVLIQWSFNEENYIKNTYIEVDGVRIKVNNLETEYLVSGLENDTGYGISMYVENDFGRESSRVDFNVRPQIQIDSFIINSKKNVDNFVLYAISIIITLITIGLATVIWAPSFYVTKVTFFKIHLFYPISLIPYLIFLLSIIYTINSDFNHFIFSLIASIGLTILAYITLLTINIINTSFYTDIPLAQASKAAQFILSLVSVYITLIYTYSSDIPVIIKFVFVSFIIFYLTFSSISALKIKRLEDILSKSVAITIVLLLMTFVMAIWPVNFIYAILLNAVIYYILLSMTLEVREKLSIYTYLEYLFLLILILVLIVFNSDWGINGQFINLPWLF